MGLGWLLGGGDEVVGMLMGHEVQWLETKPKTLNPVAQISPIPPLLRVT